MYVVVSAQDTRSQRVGGSNALEILLSVMNQMVSVSEVLTEIQELK